MIFFNLWTHLLWFLGEKVVVLVLVLVMGWHQADLTPTVLRSEHASVTLQHVYVCRSRITNLDSSCSC